MPYFINIHDYPRYVRGVRAISYWLHGYWFHDFGKQQQLMQPQKQQLLASSAMFDTLHTLKPELNDNISGIFAYANMVL